MNINEVIFMQVRILRLFCIRYGISVNKMHKIFSENGIYTLISDGYPGYHCGGDEIVYEDVKGILTERGVL